MKCIYDIDSGISIFCSKSGKDKTENITPEKIRHAVVNYDISLINDPIKRVREQYKLGRRNIEFQQDNIVLFFPLDNILNPKESQITLRSIDFYFKDSTKLKFKIDQTYSFIELQKNKNEKIIQAPSEDKFNTKAGESLQKRESPTLTSSVRHNNSTLAKRGEDKTLFIDSFQKFKNLVQDSDLLNLFSTKEKTLNSNLKSFGISLLCKLLLLTKYLNNLVDNEFQQDLHKFLKINLLETGAST